MSSTKIPLESSISQQSNQTCFCMTEKRLVFQMLYLVQVYGKLYTKVKKNELFVKPEIFTH